MALSPSTSSLGYKLRLNRRAVMGALWVAVASLIGIHVALTVVHYQFAEIPWLVRQIFDVDEEDSFPTWYSAAALFLTAFCLAVHAWFGDSSKRGDLIYWRILAVGFALMSVDEIAGMHETLNSATDISWAIPGAIFCVVLGVPFGVFLLRLPRSTAIAIVTGGAIFIGGAVGVELYTEPYLENKALNTLAYNLWTAVEEAMEMSGVLIFLNAVLKHMASGRGEVNIQVSIRE